MQYKLGETSKLKKMDEEESESQNQFKKTIDIKKLKIDIKPFINDPPP